MNTDYLKKSMTTV